VHCSTNQSLKVPPAGEQARLNGRVWALALAGQVKAPGRVYPHGRLKTLALWGASLIP
jgi:hypothetical protein